MQTWLQEVWLADEDHGASVAAPGRRRTVLLVTHDVEEALVLADRVVVLSDAPARIVADLDVPFPRPRRPELITDPALVAARARLLAALGA